jgi:hypothetical protein
LRLSDPRRCRQKISTARVEGIFGHTDEWIPNIGIALGTPGEWPLDVTLTVRAGWRDLVLPEVSITPAMRYSIGWFSIQAGAEILNEPTTGNEIFRPYVGFGAKFDTAPTRANPQ